MARSAIGGGCGLPKEKLGAQEGVSTVGTRNNAVVKETSIVRDYENQAPPCFEAIGSASAEGEGGGCMYAVRARDWRALITISRFLSLFPFRVTLDASGHAATDAIAAFSDS